MKKVMLLLIMSILLVSTVSASGIDEYTKLIIHSDEYPITEWDSSYEEFQSVATIGALDGEFFTIGSDSYLAVANHRNDDDFTIDSKIYKWNGNSFSEFQSISTAGAFDWEFFTIGSDSYLIVANHADSTSNQNVDSKTYKWNGSSFIEFQSIATVGAVDWESFTIGSDSYLAVANFRTGSDVTVDSKIYEWNGSSFIEFQTIATNGGAGWKFFTIGSASYLIVANHRNDTSYNTNSKIYKWNGSSFIEFQSITTNGAWSWESFTIGSDSYLAVANYYNGASYNINSKIYKWNGSIFVEFQNIATYGGRYCGFFTIGSDSYLAIGNYYNGAYDIDSKIYRWNGNSFIEFQSFATHGAYDWEFFTIDSDSYLSVSNHYDGSNFNIDSKIYRLTDVGFVDSSNSSHTITRNGDAVHLTDENQFGSSSIYFDQNASYLIIPSSEDFNFGIDDFTIDFWYRTPEVIVYEYKSFLQYGTDNDHRWAFDYSGKKVGQLAFVEEQGGANWKYPVNVAWTFETNTWYHLAVTRENSIWRIFVNGQLLVSNYYELTCGSYSNLWIGADVPFVGINSFAELEGYIDELRISKGIARWTENFTPPSAPYGVTTQPNYTNFAGNLDTTNFSDSNEVPDLTNVTEPVLATSHAKIEWQGSGFDVDGRDLDNAITFADNFVNVNSTELTTFNKTANVTFKTTSYPNLMAYNILKNGQLCSDCIKYSANPVKFKVTGFSNYTTNGTGIVPEFNSGIMIFLLIAGIFGLMIMRLKR